MVNKFLATPMLIVLSIVFIGMFLAAGGFGSQPNPDGTIQTNGGNTYGATLSWNLTVASVIIVLVIGVLLLSILAGVNISVFGIGIQPTTGTGQVMILKTFVYFGIWAALMAGSWWAFDAISPFGAPIQWLLTAAVAVGVVMDIQAVGGG